ncbi:hypothetical protein B0X71_17230 [Planococcus lenghuensis]|uniref:Uncharacterized protein n=1 Tax=Planococcus lenghuensis TaxID=2213202 RepID=A0A1Q2L5J7_9BACL|nr:hypothetical protein B0X71_17230 [Planococcus lenghuensis]
MNPETKIVDHYIALSVTPARKIAYGALLASLATILQSAGMLGGIGLLVSALSTLAILIGTVISLQLGFLSYLTALFLIAVIQPSELFAFPLTTGLLGLSMGFAFRYFKSGFLAAVFSGISLTLGILFILLIIKFPILGPAATSDVDFNLIMIILLFSIFYSWIWVKGFLSIVKKFSRIPGNRAFD